MDLSLEPPETDTKDANMTDLERRLSVLGGSFILTRMWKNHKIGTVLALAGGYLVYSGLTGKRPLKKWLDKTWAPGHAVNVRTSLVVNKPRNEVYAAWRKLEDIPFFMEHLDKVEQKNAKVSSWSLKVPGGLGTLEWDAEIVKEEEGKELSWHSLPGSALDNAGKINFADTPAGGTRLDLVISYKPPMGAVGEKTARLLNPLFAGAVKKDVMGFKHYLENKSTLDQ